MQKRDGTIEDQVRIERDMVGRGVARYKNSVARAEETGRATDTIYGQRIMSQYITAVTEAVEEEVAKKRGPGPRAAHIRLLANANFSVVAYLSLGTLINAIRTSNNTVAKLAIAIGSAIEDDLRFSKFHEEMPNYYETLIADYRKRGTLSYSHIRAGLSVTSRKHGVEWNNWTAHERASIGLFMLETIRCSTPLFEIVPVRQSNTPKYSTVNTVVFTEELVNWLCKFHNSMALMLPDRGPCVIQPNEWTAIDSGGYYTAQLQRSCKMVETRSNEHTAMLECADLSRVQRALNAIQNTPWAVNDAVLEVMKAVWELGLEIGLPSSKPLTIPPCPIPPEIKSADMTDAQKDEFRTWKSEARYVYTQERERVSKCFQVAQCLRMADMYNEFNRIWFVWHCDFRGRMYAHSPGISPQGSDFSKALIKFADGKPLGEEGANWLAVHGANTYGKDKVPFQERIQWVHDNSDMILAIAKDPLGMKSYWADADKPWQFLAFCFEWYGYKQHGPEFVSHLAIGLDGSCNGLQNFSAMLRDHVGGAATNLKPANSPQDIYAEVGRVLTNKIKAIETDDPIQLLWKNYIQQVGVIPRSLPKKPVMTLPYGSTQRACFDSVYSFVVEKAADFFPKETRAKAVAFITPLLWESIGEVVIAARAAMKWLQQCTRIATDGYQPLRWTAPSGFPVYQARRKVSKICVELQVSTRRRINVKLNADTLNYDKLKQAQGVSPNFVHSIDASHMVFTVNNALDAGITNFLVVHDDFGVHAADTQKFFNIIRMSFVEMYVEHDPIMEFKTSMEAGTGLILPEPPPFGNLLITEVLNSKYFFA